MITDTEIRIKGVIALKESLGDVEAERFISLHSSGRQKMLPLI